MAVLTELKFLVTLGYDLDTLDCEGFRDDLKTAAVFP